MKTIATIAATLLLSLGLAVAPANAEEPAAPTAPVVATCDGYMDVAIGLNSQLETERANVAQANETIYRMVRKLNNKQATIDRLRAELRKR